ncbi:MAG: hypothetical protein HOH33_09280 [Verrucomicrobia bacterium]|nr:hypothetical protein [Verrucomicrobiota bacterium]
MDQSFSKKIENSFIKRHHPKTMALIRVTGRPQVSGENLASRDIILNTAHVVYITPAYDSPQKCVTHMHGDDVLIVDMSFEDMWMLIQRET